MNAKSALLLILTMGSLSPLSGASDAQRKDEILKREAAPPSAEAFERRSRSIEFLKQHGVRTIPHLPVIEDSVSAKLRSPQQIAERLIGCTICAVGGETGDRELVRELVDDFDAQKLFTPQERDFVTKNIGDQKQRIQFSWRYERSWVLLWALGYIEHLDYPPSICDVPRLVALLRGKSVQQLLKAAKPRSMSEVLDEADLIYRLDWAVVDERVHGNPSVPKDVEKGVVQERHAVLNWLIGYMGQEWDEISTDT